MTNDKSDASGYHGEYERVRREPWDSLADWDRPVPPHPGPANSGEIPPGVPPWAEDDGTGEVFFGIVCLLLVTVMLGVTVWVAMSFVG